MTSLQQTIYREALQRSRKLVMIAATESTAPSTEEDLPKGRKGKTKTKTAGTTKPAVHKDSSTNVLMDLRKAASHPMLFRRRFVDHTVAAMAQILVKQPDFVKRGAVLDYVKEDMEVMTDSELQFFCDQHKVCPSIPSLLIIHAANLPHRARKNLL